MSDLPALYAALDVVVLTSKNEGTPVSLIEAGAAERPVVATRVGGVPDVVREGETGLLVPLGDDEAISRALSDLLSDRNRSALMGRAATEWVRGRFAADRLAADLAELYRTLMDRGRA